MRIQHVSMIALGALMATVGFGCSGSASGNPPTFIGAPSSSNFTIVAGGTTVLGLPGIGSTTASIVTFQSPVSGGGTTGHYALSASDPVSTALVAGKRPAGGGPSGVWYFSFVLNHDVVWNKTPQLNLEFASSQAAFTFSSALYDPIAGAWTEPWSGPGTPSNAGLTLQIAATPIPSRTFAAGQNYVIAVYQTPATPPPGPVELTQPTLSFSALGSGSAQTTTASETNYAGTFTATTTDCSGVATIDTTDNLTFTVTPVGDGSCSFTITGAAGNSTTLGVNISTASPA